MESSLEGKHLLAICLVDLERNGAMKPAAKILIWGVLWPYSFPDYSRGICFFANHLHARLWRPSLDELQCFATSWVPVTFGSALATVTSPFAVRLCYNTSFSVFLHVKQLYSIVYGVHMFSSSRCALPGRNPKNIRRAVSVLDKYGHISIELVDPSNGSYY